VITERAASTVTNFGTINMSAAPYGAGVVLQDGGAIINGSSADKAALITAEHGAYVLGAPGSVTNFGTIDGGVFVLYGGGVTNGAGADSTARITGTVGAELFATSSATVSLTNFGTVVGTASKGVFGGTGVSVINGWTTDTAALIEGVTVGAQLAGTVTNFGTIEATGAGGYSVKFTDAASTLFAESGSRFIGAADVGGSRTDVVGGIATFSGGILSGGTIQGAGTLALAGGISSLGAGALLSVSHISVSGAATSVDFGATLTYAGVWAQSAGTISVASGDTLRFTGLGDSFTGSLAGAGAIMFAGGSDSLSGVTVSNAHASITGATVTMSGTIALTAALSLNASRLLVGASGAHLTGGGWLLLSNSTANTIQGASATAVLDNVNVRIAGAGQLGNGQMALTNEAAGVINARDSSALVINVGTNTVANAGVIESAASGGLSISSPINNTHALIAAAGSLSVTGAVTGAGTVYVEGGTAHFASSFSENVTFTAAAGSVLELAHSQAYTGRISGFSKTGASAIDLLDIAYGAGTKASFSGTTASGTLTVTDGTHTARIILIGNYTASTFTVSSDGHSGTKVVDPTAAPSASILASAMAGFAPKTASQSRAVEATHASVSLLATPRTELQ
jgi:hypothetical protein